MEVQISPEIESQLEEVAHRTGESKDDLVRDALLSYLDDLHDIAIAREHMDHPDETLSLDEMKRNVGLDD